jgi:hypothetical protein
MTSTTIKQDTLPSESEYDDFLQVFKGLPIVYYNNIDNCRRQYNSNEEVTIHEGAAGYPYDSSRGKAALAETSQEVEQLLP